VFIISSLTIPVILRLTISDTGNTYMGHYQNPNQPQDAGNNHANQYRRGARMAETLPIHMQNQGVKEIKVTS
jgi:hypothetical protein